MVVDATYLAHMEAEIEFRRHIAIDAMLDPSRPYNDLPPLPPNVEVETRAVLKNAWRPAPRSPNCALPAI